ncbi:MAG: acylphosphatase [Candidatus Melainabacteria bacterium]|nr:acylphosphatase [Candidatus Melainabacteria bacterium]MBI3308168.1 acylphosphatase [Candidatus Melainabacteria bacterium]
MQQVHLIISGTVQGVFYRASCQDVAVKYGLNGYVKNLLNGQVEVVAQGEKEQLEKLVEWCKKGPPHAQVDNVEITWEDVDKTHNAFTVL